jgi:hypothetical protein
MIVWSATMLRMGFQLTYTGGGFYTWELYGADRSTLSLEASASGGPVIVGNNGDGRFLGESTELITSVPRLRSIAAAFGDRMILMSKADSFGELINFILANEELHNIS